MRELRIAIQRIIRYRPGGEPMAARLPSWLSVARRGSSPRASRERAIMGLVLPFVLLFSAWRRQCKPLYLADLRMIIG